VGKRRKAEEILIVDKQGDGKRTGRQAREEFFPQEVGDDFV